MAAYKIAKTPQQADIDHLLAGVEKSNIIPPRKAEIAVGKMALRDTAEDKAVNAQTFPQRFARPRAANEPSLYELNQAYERRKKGFTDAAKKAGYDDGITQRAWDKVDKAVFGSIGANSAKELDKLEKTNPNLAKNLDVFRMVMATPYAIYYPEEIQSVTDPKIRRMMEDHNKQAYTPTKPGETGLEKAMSQHMDPLLNDPSKMGQYMDGVKAEYDKIQELQKARAAFASVTENKNLKEAREKKEEKAQQEKAKEKKDEKKGDETVQEILKFDPGYIDQLPLNVRNRMKMAGRTMGFYRGNSEQIAA